MSINSSDDGSWPKSLTFVKGLDDSLRCPICFDYMHAPMLLPNCQHNFCSLCIRRYFVHKEQCPVCSSSASSSELRSNYTFDITIQQYRKIRQPLLELATNKQCKCGTSAVQAGPSSQGASPQGKMTEPPVETRPNNATTSAFRSSLQSAKCAESSSKGEKKNSRENSLARKCVVNTMKVVKRSSKTSESSSESDSSDVEILSEDGETSQNLSPLQLKENYSLLSCHSPVDGLKLKTFQSKIFAHMRRSSDQTNPPTAEKSTLELSSQKENMTLSSGKKAESPIPSTLDTPPALSKVPSPPVSPNMVPSPLLSPNHCLFKKDGGKGISSPTSSPQGEKVPCPVCGVPVLAQAVNHHLDLCLASSEKKAALQLSERRKPLPKLVYNLMPDKDIRRRLKELGLNTQGDRQTLIKRHHEFTLLHNADCDSITPKPMSDLVKEFEETQGLQKKLTARTANKQSILRFTKDCKKEDIEKANKSYVLQHKAQFKMLIRDARNRMEALAQNQDKLDSVQGSSPDKGNPSELQESSQGAHKNLALPSSASEKTAEFENVCTDARGDCTDARGDCTNAEQSVADSTEEVRVTVETSDKLSCVDVNNRIEEGVKGMGNTHSDFPKVDDAYCESLSQTGNHVHQDSTSSPEFVMHNMASTRSQVESVSAPEGHSESDDAARGTSDLMCFDLATSSHTAHTECGDVKDSQQAYLSSVESPCSNSGEADDNPNHSSGVCEAETSSCSLFSVTDTVDATVFSKSSLPKGEVKGVHPEKRSSRAKRRKLDSKVIGTSISNDHRKDITSTAGLVVVPDQSRNRPQGVSEMDPRFDQEKATGTCTQSDVIVYDPNHVAQEEEGDRQFEEPVPASSAMKKEKRSSHKRKHKAQLSTVCLEDGSEKDNTAETVQNILDLSSERQENYKRKSVQRSQLENGSPDAQSSSAKSDEHDGQAVDIVTENSVKTKKKPRLTQKELLENCLHATASLKYCSHEEAVQTSTDYSKLQPEPVQYSHAKLKSLLKKKCNNGIMFKKSVRFHGLKMFETVAFDGESSLSGPQLSDEFSSEASEENITSSSLGESNACSAGGEESLEPEVNEKMMCEKTSSKCQDDVQTVQQSEEARIFQAGPMNGKSAKKLKKSRGKKPKTLQTTNLDVVLHCPEDNAGSELIASANKAESDIQRKLAAGGLPSAFSDGNKADEAQLIELMSPKKSHRRQHKARKPLHIRKETVVDSLSENGFSDQASSMDVLSTKTKNRPRKRKYECVDVSAHRQVELEIENLDNCGGLGDFLASPADSVKTKQRRAKAKLKHKC